MHGWSVDPRDCTHDRQGISMQDFIDFLYPFGGEASKMIEYAFGSDIAAQLSNASNYNDIGLLYSVVEKLREDDVMTRDCGYCSPENWTVRTSPPSEIIFRNRLDKLGPYFVQYQWKLPNGIVDPMSYQSLKSYTNKFIWWLCEKNVYNYIYIDSKDHFDINNYYQAYQNIVPIYVTYVINSSTYSHDDHTHHKSWWFYYLLDSVKWWLNWDKLHLTSIDIAGNGFWINENTIITTNNIIRKSIRYSVVENQVSRTFYHNLHSNSCIECIYSTGIDNNTLNTALFEYKLNHVSVGILNGDESSGTNIHKSEIEEIEIDTATLTYSNDISHIKIDDVAWDGGAKTNFFIPAECKVGDEVILLGYPSRPLDKAYKQNGCHIDPNILSKCFHFNDKQHYGLNSLAVVETTISKIECNKQNGYKLHIDGYSSQGFAKGAPILLKRDITKFCGVLTGFYRQVTSTAWNETLYGICSNHPSLFAQ